MLFVWDSSLFVIVARTLIVYVAFLVGLRLLGTRALGQATLVDLVLLLLISNAVQNAMIGPDTSLDGGLVSALTLLVANYAVAQLSDRVPLLRRLTAGEPIILVRDGHLVVPNCARERVSSEEVDAAIRSHGLDGIRSVKLAVLEIDGTISIIGADAQPLTIAADRVHAHHNRRRLRGRRRR